MTKVSCAARRAEMGEAKRPGKGSAGVGRIGPIVGARRRMVRPSGTVRLGRSGGRPDDARVDEGSYGGAGGSGLTLYGSPRKAVTDRVRSIS